MKTGLLCVALVAMAGCAPLDSVPIQPAPMAMKDCSAVAMAAVNDAAAHSYNAVMQDVVYKNSYNNCAAAKVSLNVEK